MYIFELKNKAVKELESLPIKTRERILEKLKFYSLQKNPLKFASKIKDKKFGEFKFRIGDYRAIFDVEKNKVTILKIGHRKDIYKRL